MLNSYLKLRSKEVLTWFDRYLVQNISSESVGGTNETRVLSMLAPWLSPISSFGCHLCQTLFPHLFLLNLPVSLASAPLQKHSRSCSIRPLCAWDIHIPQPRTELGWISCLAKSMCAAQRSLLPWHRTLMTPGRAAGSPLPNFRAGHGGYSRRGGTETGKGVATCVSQPRSSPCWSKKKGLFCSKSFLHFQILPSPSLASFSLTVMVTPKAHVLQPDLGLSTASYWSQQTVRSVSSHRVIHSVQFAGSNSLLGFPKPLWKVFRDL